MTLTSEPALIALDSPGCRSFFFGVCAGYLIVFIRAALNHRLRPSHLLTFPLLGGLSLYLIVIHFFKSSFAFFDSFVKPLTAFLDFPVSAIEAVLTVRLICFFSRYFLNTFGTPPTPRTPGALPDRLTTPFVSIVTALAVFAGAVGFTLLLYGWLPYVATVYGIAAVVLLFIAVAAAVLFDSGIVSDSALVVLRVALSVAPAASYSSGQLTWWLRSAFVVAAFLSLPYDLEGLSSGARRASARLPAVGVLINAVRRGPGAQEFRRRDAGWALVGFLLSYMLLSPGAFLTASTRICHWQAIVVPVVYLGIVLNEARYFHTAVTPVGGNERRGRFR